MDEISRLYAKKPIVKRSKSSLRIKRKKSSQQLKSPADRILFLQRTIGNQAVQRMVRSGALQAKLKIGQPGDIYEQEADRVADAVMRIPEPGVQRQVEPEEEKKEEEELLRIKEASDQIPEVTPAINPGIQLLQGGGRPLSGTEQSFFEPRFGADFSNVRIHSDKRASNVARSVNARAFTFGHNVVFPLNTVPAIVIPP